MDPAAFVMPHLGDPGLAGTHIEDYICYMAALEDGPDYVGYFVAILLACSWSAIRRLGLLIWCCTDGACSRFRVAATSKEQPS